MKFLLDTHVLIWAIDTPNLLSLKVRKALVDDSNELYVSVASLWEIALKVQAGKLSFPDDPSFLEGHLRSLGIKSYLQLGLFHVYQLAKLPILHKDPFDRILLAQAMVEGWTFVTKDRNLSAYPVKTFW